MNMPDFTAEAALHQTSGSHRMVQTSAPSMATGLVVPAIPSQGNCSWMCDQCDRCETGVLTSPYCGTWCSLCDRCWIWYGWVP